MNDQLKSVFSHLPERPGISSSWNGLWSIAWLLVFLLCPKEGRAWSVLTNDDYWMCYQGGKENIHFKFGLYDKDGRDTWVEHGKVFVSEPGGSEYELFYFEAEHNIGDSQEKNTAKTRFYGKGKFILHRSGREDVQSVYDLKDFPVYSGNDYYSFEADWFVPFELRGKELKFRFEIEMWQHAYKTWWYKNTYAASTTEADKLLYPDIVSAVLCAGSDHVKQTEVMWQIAASTVVSATAYYKLDGVQKEQDLGTSSFGSFYIPSDKPISDLYVKVKYKDTDKIERETQSTVFPVGMLHQAQSMSVTLDDEGQAQLKWNVDYAKKADIMESDNWLIQRNLDYDALNPDAGTWSIIDQLSFNSDDAVVSYTDETLPAVYSGGRVAYRVQRSIAINWGWSRTSGVPTADLKYRLVLPTIDYASVQKTSVWGSGSENKHQMLLKWETTETERDNLVDGDTYYLRSALDWNAFCAQVSQGSTKINAVMLADIVLTEDDESMVGDELNLYAGTFDGQGHTLTVNYKAKTGEDKNPQSYKAPFSAITSGAVIKNLHVAGLVETYAKFASGLVGKASGGTVKIMNCRVSTKIQSHVNGDGTHGGIVAFLGDDLEMNNCIFDGGFDGSSTHSWGGLVGWRNKSSASAAQLVNCVFAPSQCNVGNTSCATICRGYSISNLPANNCYYTMTLGTVQGNKVSEKPSEMQAKLGYHWVVEDGACQPVMGTIHIRTADDWRKFALLVNNSMTAMNAVLEADIDVPSDVEVGNSLALAYSGRFDGQGHTLRLNMAKSPIRYARNAAFANLHLVGKLTTSNRYTSGLIGTVPAGGRLQLYQIHSSVTIESSVTDGGYHGGLIGLIQSGGTGGSSAAETAVTITDCSFTGEFIGSKTFFWGGLVGARTDVNATLQLRNCLFAPAKVDVAYMEIGSNHFATLARSTTELGEWSETGLSIENCYYTLGVGTLQGEDAKDASLELLATYLGRNWKVVSDQIELRMNHNMGVSDAVCLWDDRAKVTLFIDKYVGKEKRYTEERPISDAELKAKKATIDLTTSCVYYDFRMVVDRNGSTRSIDKKAADVQTDEYHLANSAIDKIEIKDPLVIKNVSDWELFAQRVKNGEESLNAVLNNDVDLGESQTDIAHSSWYKGVFDGQGHTLTVHYTKAGVGAPFYGLSGATVRNLHVAGEIHPGGYPDAGGIAKEVCRNVLIENCRVSADIVNHQSMTGGLIGEVVASSSSSTKVIIQNCLFDGKLMVGVNEPDHAGGFIGYASFTNKKDLEITIANSLFAPAAVGNPNSTCFTLIGAEDKGSMSEALHIVNTYYTTTYGPEQGVKMTETLAAEQVKKLGTEWQVADGAALPKRSTDKYLEQLFYFDNNVEMATLNAEEQQSSVMLTWTVNGGQADYYRITRRDLQSTEEEELEKEFQQMAYVDKTVRPQHTYLYTVEGVTSCEGLHVSSISKEGHCKFTGMVRGYVRLFDGTALPGRTVTAKPTGDIKGAEIKTAVTDDRGYFEIGDLVYQGTGTYSLNVETKGNEDPFETLYADFNDEFNLRTNLVFTQSNYFKFKGIVLYDGSSIPVVGAQFKRDGQIIKNAKGEPVTTDSRGEFNLSIPRGSHQVQVVKEGHQFENDGYYLTPEGSRDVNWEKDRYEIYLYDQTRVKLRGRIVGGSKQGDLPLGQSLSRNNLGQGITMVLRLEGDNTSHIVHDILNSKLTERHQYFLHGAIDEKTGQPKDTTFMDSYLNRIVIHPDSLTGEFEVPIFPVKYKVTEIYASGYPTLFQKGSVAETLDLTDYGHEKTAEYKRIYHSAPILHVEQVNPLNESYFGLKQYTAIDNAGQKMVVNLWDENTEKYSLGHPVFMEGSNVILAMQAREEYYYNNADSLIDVVPLSGGKVQMKNGLISSTTTKDVELNAEGEGTYTFTPQNDTFTNDGDLALRALTMTMLLDSTYFDQKPITGYVMASRAKSQGRRVVAKGGTHLLDILRDPPGATSSAYIESGAKYNYTFNCDVTAKVGLGIEYQQGTGSNYYSGEYMGSQALGTEMGQIHNAETQSYWSTEISSTYNNTWQFSYNFETSEKIQTSSNNKQVGPAADLFIGVTNNVVMEDAVAVRVVPRKMYQYLVPRESGTAVINGSSFKVKSGTVKTLARGYDPVEKDSVYLISDEVMRSGIEMVSSFVHSQAYIVEELIPTLVKERNALMLPKGTTDAYAKEVAKTQGKPVYISKVAENDETFASTDADGKETYVMVAPDDATYSDEIKSINAELLTWVQFLAQNEREKLQASHLVRSYDFDGRSSVTYAETFSVGDSETRYWKLPLLGGESITFGAFKALEKLLSGLSKAQAGQAKELQQNEDGGTWMELVFHVAGTYRYFKFKPIVSIDTNYKFGESDTYSKKTGFTLACSTKSNLLVDVYRTNTDLDYYQKLADDETIKELINKGQINVIFPTKSDEILSYVKNGSKGQVSSAIMSWLTYVKYDQARYGNFVFRTRGGATCSPYEDERKTQYYNAGSQLDAKTIAIDNLRIWTNQATVSNVPYGEPARFKVHISNDTDMPDRCTQFFDLFLDEASNAHGAKVYVDGTPLNGQGFRFYLAPGETLTKEIQIYAGSVFDYENIGISLSDPDDIKRVSTQKLSAHFVPSAGKINISVPSDKWVINTESEYDKERQDYFLPVRIDDFNTNFRGFDHIELQYKLSTEGEKGWVNVCSYYKDKNLMAQASGARDTIKNDGYIMASFYGEAGKIEQYYDLRAVVYCRNGEGFITTSSPILTGVKDTRRPEPFGTPKPSNGILGIGDDITIAFSEPIAGNYLSKVTNFDVLGQTNTTNISLETSLRFNGTDMVFGQGMRNLATKSFTIDMMLNPDDNNKTMTFFSHNGTTEGWMELAMTGGRKLVAVLNDTVLMSKDPVAFNNGMSQINVVFEIDTEKRVTNVRFYDGSKNIGSCTYKKIYEGAGNVFFGGPFYSQFFDSPFKSSMYEGSMMEYRLWNRALTESEMNAYKNRRLTGYELGLLDNYPMDEGHGDNCFNKAPGGSDMVIQGATWNVPNGIAMKLDGKQGFRLDNKYFNRESFQDYTMMFWFRTTDHDGVIFSNGFAKDEPNYKDHFNFAVNDGQLRLRLGGNDITTSGSVDDGDWHHVALTVNRSRNVGNLYVDQKLKESFAVDTLGGILGGYLAAGAVYKDSKTPQEAITGHIDEIGMFEMVLPENIIKTYSGSTPTGGEMGMMAYLNFSRNELQKDHSQRLMPTGISLRRDRDGNTHELSESHDTIVAQSVIDALADRLTFAPMKGAGELENISFSYVSDGKDLLVNLDVPDYKLEKNNVYITVRDVADLNGNRVASPILMDLYVYKNPLRWNMKRVNLDVRYGTEATFEAKVVNYSGKSQNYNISGLPMWISASKTQGVISALDEESIIFSVSPYINIGDFDELICLTTENGMNEPLPINIKVRGDEPDWTINNGLLRNGLNMQVVARIVIDGNVAHDPEDMVAVFGNNHELLGVTHIDVDNSANANEGLAYISIYANSHEAIPLQYEFFDASSGRIYVLKAEGEAATFQADAIVGSAPNPVVLRNGDMMVQRLQLKAGWNWMSFNVQPEADKLSNLLGNATAWEPGDGFEVINSEGEPCLFTYKAIPNPKDPSRQIYYWDNGDKEMQLNTHLMYRFYSRNDKPAYVTGEKAYTYIKLTNGWNRIGYTAQLNLPLATALSDYTEKGTVGDIIKSQSEFAVLNIDAQGNRSWKGTLKYMRIGEGYKLYRKSEEKTWFNYPSYGNGSPYGLVSHSSRSTTFENTSGTSMTMVACAEGIRATEGDRLTAYRGAEPCGVAVADADGVFYLNIGDVETASSQLSFVLERNDEVMGVANSRLLYKPDVALGTPDAPTTISFATMDSFNADGWFTVGGQKLSRRPNRKGVYIHNGEKITIK